MHVKWNRLDVCMDDIGHADNVWSTEKSIQMPKLKLYLQLYQKQNRMLKINVFYSGDLECVFQNFI